MQKILIVFLASFLFVIPIVASQASDHRPIIAVMVSDDHYDADKLLPPLMEKLGKENNWEIAVLHGHGTSNFPNIDILDKADVLVVFVRRLALPKDQLAKVKKFVEAGKGFVGLRTACHGFESKAKPLPDGCENWAELDRDVLGGNYHNHGRNDIGSEIQNVAAMTDSPILKDVQPAQWHSEGSLYFTDPVKKDATVYQTASSIQQKDIPLTWTRMHGKTRVAYTALGHQKDFEVGAFQKLLRNLIQWTLTEPAKSQP